MNDNKAYLYERLIKLGDLIGDGCHLEPDGKWIENEYRQTMRLLGFKPSVKKKAIHTFSNRRIYETTVYRYCL